jgi:hypothetical protein
VTAHSIVIGLLLTFPWALVGIVTLGTAVTAVQRWLGRFRSPDQARMAGRFIRSQSRRDGGRQVLMRPGSANPPGAALQAQPIRRAA